MKKEFVVTANVSYEVICLLCGASSGEWYTEFEAEHRARLLGFVTITTPDFVINNVCSVCKKDFPVGG